MSIALVATLYGIALANLIVIPIGENLTAAAKETKRKNVIIIEGIRLIAARTNPIVLAEELNSYLLPRERIDWKNVS
jgi:chemotaxis protein MotA